MAEEIEMPQGLQWIIVLLSLQILFGFISMIRVAALKGFLYLPNILLVIVILINSIIIYGIYKRTRTAYYFMLFSYIISIIIYIVVTFSSIIGNISGSIISLIINILIIIYLIKVKSYFLEENIETNQKKGSKKQDKKEQGDVFFKVLVYGSIIFMIALILAFIIFLIR